MPVSTLSALADPLVAVHGQSDQHRLLRPGAPARRARQLRGRPTLAPADAVRRGLRLAARHRAELADVVESARERAREADLLRFGLGEIEQVDPQPGEDVALAAEEARLGFADTLRTAAEQARECLSAEDGGPTRSAPCPPRASSSTASASTTPRPAGLADRLAEISYLLSDLGGRRGFVRLRLDTDPARLAAVSERRAALVALTRKYGDTSTTCWPGPSRPRAGCSSSTTPTSGSSSSPRSATGSARARRGGRRADRRRDQGGRAGSARVVTAELASLAMPHARLTIAVDPGHDRRAGPPVGGRTAALRPRPGSTTSSCCSAANRGAEPRPLGKGASGGELSRVMLAVEVALAGTNPVPDLRLRRGRRRRRRQGRGRGRPAAGAAGPATPRSLVVTHLPQVAAFADRHVVVVKSSDGTVTSSGLTVLDDAGRVRELSRMLAGLEDSDTALAHAEELLAAAQESRTAGCTGPGRVDCVTRAPAPPGICCRCVSG